MILADSACVHVSTNGTNVIPISFKVLPMVPLVLPLVPMVMPMVPLALPIATNGSIGKITNGTIGRTPNRASVFEQENLYYDEHFFEIL